MSKKILVCDDDLGIIEVLRIILETNNYTVRVLTEGKGIVKKVIEYQPHLILLDLWMPGVAGKEITGLLKKEEKTKHIPIIIVSALNETEKIAKEIGANGFLCKPFDMNELLNKVESMTKSTDGEMKNISR